MGGEVGRSKFSTLEEEPSLGPRSKGGGGGAGEIVGGGEGKGAANGKPGETAKRPTAAPQRTAWKFPPAASTPTLRALRSRSRRLFEEGVLVCVAITAFLLLARSSNVSLNMVHQLFSFTTSSKEMKTCAAASIARSRDEASLVERKDILLS